MSEQTHEICLTQFQQEIIKYMSEYFGTECTVEEDEDNNKVAYFKHNDFLIQISLPETESAIVFYASKKLYNQYAIENAKEINEFVLRSEYGSYSIREVSPDNYFYFYTTTIVPEGMIDKENCNTLMDKIINEVYLGDVINRLAGYGQE